MNKEQLLREALSLPTNAIEYYVSQILADRFPKKALVEGGEGYFNLDEYAAAGLCQNEYQAIVYNHVVTYWRGREMEVFGKAPRALYSALAGSGLLPEQSQEGREIFDRPKNAWLKVSWREHTFDVVVMHWGESMHRVYHYWIIGESEAVAKEFLKEVCRWNAEVRGEVLVFDGGCWQKDASLFQAIKDATFENLILQGSLKEEIREDLRQFFEAREIYETYGIPWKRGILFVGPPGNGKTHAVKAIINAMDQPCLYVKSFRAEHRTDEDNIRDVFDRARKSAPCILVLEDLDSLLNAQNRSFFLNELDGFAANRGVVTLATTNHPERLDPAILDRPSRFDRKYPFDLPELAERRAYIQLWNGSLKDELKLSEEGIERVSLGTEGFSFAYLKELFLSSMMRWIAKPEQGSMETVMLGQSEVLRAQMVSAMEREAKEPEESADQQALLQSMRRMVPRTMVYRGGM